MRTRSPIWIWTAAFLCLGLAGFLPLTAAAATSNSASTTANARPPKSNADLRYWLQNMVWYHHFTLEEMEAALGLSRAQIADALRTYRITSAGRPERGESASLLVVPYPGGRHPRIGFLDGALEPQRETKLSVFTPWDEKSYVVIDVPEAIWSNLGLTYLAHTHIPTVWSQAKIALPKLEWRRRKDGSFQLERKLPNGLSFATLVMPSRDAVRLEIKLFNGSTNHLSDLRVQMCAMLKGVAGFNQQTNANKIFAKPFSACRSDDGMRWIIWAWEPAHRTWGNPPVPCLHSDPKFKDCAPGQSQVIRGWMSFYEGTDIRSELTRIEQDPWLVQAAASAGP
ncbi:MAG: hypothetical protein JNN07_26125 [Verrucomicrobiales bacterium]|nr:hypothetical protein [Verrucomicrobiales bacterium]